MEGAEGGLQDVFRQPISFADGRLPRTAGTGRPSFCARKSLVFMNTTDKDENPWGDLGTLGEKRSDVRKKRDHRKGRTRGQTRARRIRTRHFSDVDVFETHAKFFVPLPMLYRKILHTLQPRLWMILSWLMMNARPEGVPHLPT